MSKTPCTHNEMVESGIPGYVWKGSVTSPKKARASKRNGKKGGAPTKENR